MAKSNSRYIQFYTPGSVACKVELRQEQEWAPLPKQKSVKKIIVAVDPVAILGCLVAVCMLVLMAVGIRQLNAARQEVTVLEHYVAQLTAENQNLTQTYKDGYDPEVIRQKALDMGMVPAQDIPVKQIRVDVPKTSAATEGKQSRWDAFLSTLTE